MQTLGSAILHKHKENMFSNSRFMQIQTGGSISNGINL
jgi:hypothetical protein